MVRVGSYVSGGSDDSIEVEGGSCFLLGEGTEAAVVVMGASEPPGCAGLLVATT